MISSVTKHLKQIKKNKPRWLKIVRCWRVSLKQFIIRNLLRDWSKLASSLQPIICKSVRPFPICSVTFFCLWGSKYQIHSSSFAQNFYVFVFCPLGFDFVFATLNRHSFHFNISCQTTKENVLKSKKISF